MKSPLSYKKNSIWATIKEHYLHRNTHTHTHHTHILYTTVYTVYFPAFLYIANHIQELSSLFLFCFAKLLAKCTILQHGQCVCHVLRRIPAVFLFLFSLCGRWRQGYDWPQIPPWSYDEVDLGSARAAILLSGLETVQYVVPDFLVLMPTYCTEQTGWLPLECCFKDLLILAMQCRLIYCW